MSQRVKRPNRTDDGCIPTKRRKRPTMEEEEAASLAAAASWQPRPFNDLKSIYNRTATEAPAELFRKDLISAMKLPDSEPLASDEYWVIVDQWKQEWERGVQVPVNPDSLPEPSVMVNQSSIIKTLQEFKIPKTKYIRITKDEHFHIDKHVLSTAPARFEAACSYDLDETDAVWLKLLNGERATCGLSSVSEEKLERVIERLEVNCWDKIQSILRNEEGLGIEYDENVICDVCRSPDSEEGNEMVFCDSCNICVHQACYGITRIPEGQWLCGTCAISQRPECVLCPNKGGAMKATRSGQKWAHVSCALWIPEVSIGCVEKMEPITKVSSIPQSRWALICVLCRERVGACIQCSVKTCKTAYHVTCAFKHGLEMRAIIEDENADDGVKLRSYCEKHSKISKKEKSTCSGSEDDDNRRKKRKDMTSEEKNQARAARLQEIEAEFDKHVNIKDINMRLDVDNHALQYIYNYWKLKRRAGNNKPLLSPKPEDVDMLSHKQEQADLEKMKTFVQLRQDLERVRNLCYMVSRREKLSRTCFRTREQTFHMQAAVLSSSHSLSSLITHAIIEANHGPSIYDRLYSHSDAEDHTDFELILARIAGRTKEIRSPDMNGILKNVKNENPYKRTYFNGSSKRRSASLYGGSTTDAGVASSSDERHFKSFTDYKSCIVHRGSGTSSADEEKHSPTTLKRKGVRPRLSKKRRKHLMPHSIKGESSSEEDTKNSCKSRLQQVRSDLGMSGTESDEFHKTRSESQRSKAISSIYSESDNSNASNSQQSRFRTKAAVKEFINKPSTSKISNKTNSPTPKKKSKPVYIPSDLIVPQREAAKKASENMKSSSTARVFGKEILEQPSIVEITPSSPETKPKIKQKRDVKVTPKKEKIAVVDIFDIENEKEDEILSYVPQRQAAKKATENIKSGLGKPPTANIISDLGPDKDKHSLQETTVKPAKIQDNKRKSSTNTNSTTSSAASSSSDSSDSSSTESETDQNKPQSDSLLMQTKRLNTTVKDWPFLDKVAKSEASSNSESFRTKKCTTPTRTESLGNSSRGRPSKSGNRDSDVGSRNIIDSETLEERGKNWKGKSDTVGESGKKEINKPNNVYASIGKEDKRLNNIEHLEREILERKSNCNNSNNKSKTNLNRLFSDKANDQNKKLYNLQKHSNKFQKPPSTPKQTINQTKYSKSDSSDSEYSNSSETSTKPESLNKTKTFKKHNKVTSQKLHETTEHRFFSNFSKSSNEPASKAPRQLSNKCSPNKTLKCDIGIGERHHKKSPLRSSKLTKKSKREDHKLIQEDVKLSSGHPSKSIKKLKEDDNTSSFQKGGECYKSSRKSVTDVPNATDKKQHKNDFKSSSKKIHHKNLNAAVKQQTMENDLEDLIIETQTPKTSRETSLSPLHTETFINNLKNNNEIASPKNTNTKNRQSNLTDNTKLPEKHSKCPEKESDSKLELHGHITSTFENEMASVKEYCETDIPRNQCVSPIESYCHYTSKKNLKSQESLLEINKKSSKQPKSEDLEKVELTENLLESTIISEKPLELPEIDEKSDLELHEKQHTNYSLERCKSQVDLSKSKISSLEKQAMESNMKMSNNEHDQSSSNLFDAQGSQIYSNITDDQHFRLSQNSQTGLFQNVPELFQSEIFNNYHTRLAETVPELYEKRDSMFEKPLRIYEKHLNVTEERTNLVEMPEHYVNTTDNQPQSNSLDRVLNAKIPEVYKNSRLLEPHERHTLANTFDNPPNSFLHETLFEKQMPIYEKFQNLPNKQNQSFGMHLHLHDKQFDGSVNLSHTHEKQNVLDKQTLLYDKSTNVSKNQPQLHEKTLNVPAKSSQQYEKLSSMPVKQSEIYEKVCNFSDRQQPPRVSEKQHEIYENLSNLPEKSLNMLEPRYSDQARLSEIYSDVIEKPVEGGALHITNKKTKSLELNEMVESFEKHSRFPDYSFAFNQQFSENAMGFVDFTDFSNNYKMRMCAIDTFQSPDDYIKLLEKSSVNKVENNITYKSKTDIKLPELSIPVLKVPDESTVKLTSPSVHKDGHELLDFDMLEDGFGISKAPLGFSLGNVTLFKEDSKEDSARETLNLVEKLRMELSKKSSSNNDLDDTISIASSNTTTRNDVPNDVEDHATYPPETRNENVPKDNIANVLQGSLDPSNLQADERWVPPSKIETADVPLTLQQATPYLEPCSPSPYADIHPQAKWADSQVMPARRSSSSSAASTPRSCSRDNEERPEVMVMNHPSLEMQFGSVLHQFQGESYNTQLSDPQFINPVSLFPPPAPNFNTQVPFPSPGAAMFPPVYHTPTPLSKPAESPICTVAFTSSEHNMALTAAMVNLPTPIATETAPPLKPTPTACKKSPSKPTRTSARFLNKSPEKSPRTVDPPKPSGPGRGRNSDKRGANRGLARGRGRGRGRGKTVSVQPQHHEHDTINKLVGTVYDFDFDDENESMADLKSLRERRKSADVHAQSPKLSETRSPKLQPVINKTPPAPTIVEPVLPGPVDMRTYSNFDESQPYNLLTALSATEPVVPEDIDEDFEKVIPEIANNIKASLSDSRNQLKVKIKGPIANYTASIPTPTTIPNTSSSNVVNNVSVGVSSGTSNLRRMRKKELLRQYWTQENMDDNATVPGIAAVPTVVPMNRTTITIPKAVASMTSIPTRDDYRDYRTGTDEVVETKVRKETKARPGALSRELKQLDLPTEGTEGVPNERRRKPVVVKTAPKLKIKIAGTHSIITDRIRPPKKRLSTITQPSVEDLKRESMKFRKLVMADFGDRKKKKDKSSKHHKRKKRQQVEIVSNEDANSTKLIIRFNRKADSECENKKSSHNNIVDDQKVNNSVDVLKDTENNVQPIKLKFSRCQAGSGYVMKTDDAPLLPEPPVPLPLNKDCEVR